MSYHGYDRYYSMLMQYTSLPLYGYILELMIIQCRCMAKPPRLEAAVAGLCVQLCCSRLSHLRAKQVKLILQPSLAARLSTIANMQNCQA